MPVSSKPFEEPQEPSQSQNKKHNSTLPELISVAAPPVDPDIGESQKPLPSQDEKDNPAPSTPISIAPSLKDLDPDIGESPEPLHSAYENDDTPTVSLKDLDLDGGESQKPLHSAYENDDTPTVSLKDLALDVGESQKPLHSAYENDDTPTVSLKDLALDVGESQKPLLSQDEKDNPAPSTPISIATSLKDLDPDVGEPLVRLHSAYKNDDSPTVMSLVALPKYLDPHGKFGIRQRHSNFFLLGSSSHAQVASAQRTEKTSQGDGNDREEMQVVVTALDILARSGTPLKTHALPASSGENNGKQYTPEPRTSTSVLLATGLKTVETPHVNASIPGWLRVVIIFLGLAATFATHAINMFNYPHYEADEGTYMMYAWAVTHGHLDPYAYGYGHPPLAWIQIAAWVKLTGGFFTFGNALNSGRVLMLVLAVASAWLIHRIAYHLRLNFMACFLAMLLFALSPLSVTFQREILLDNFAAFWFLLALYLIIVGKSRLSYTISAGICFGFALLSKEVLIILFPVLIYVVWLYTTRFQRTFLLVSFIYTVIAVGSTFVLLAVLRGELFPYEWHLPWDKHPHLSLIGVYLVQVARGQNQGSIHESWAVWANADFLLTILGLATPVFNLIFGWWNRKRLFLALFALIFWALLLRGGVVFAFYIIPLIPLIALNMATALDIITSWIGRVMHFNLVSGILILVVLVALIPYDIQHSLSPYNIYSDRPALVQTEALTWIRAHVPRRAVVVINSNLFTDLHEPQGDGVGDGAVYPYAHVYWFVALDPELHDTLLKKNWDRIDYIVADSEMIQNVQNYGGGMDIIKTAQQHSVLRVEFKGDNNEVMRIYQVIHINPPPDV